MAETTRRTTRSRQTKTETAKSTGGQREEHRLQEQIKQRAYQLWEQEGRPHGREDAHWQQAEREIRGTQAGSGGRTPASAGRTSRARDTTGAMARPAKGKQPGASAALGGTPSAPAAGPGRGSRIQKTR